MIILEKKLYIYQNHNVNNTFPLIILDNSISDYPKSINLKSMHWHNELQIIYVHTGEIVIETLLEKIVLQKNEILFINENVIHRIFAQSNSHYNSFIFNKKFLFFFNDSIMAKDYVIPYVNNKNITVFKIKNKSSNITKILKDTYSLYMSNNNHYKIAINIACIWDFLKDDLGLLAKDINKENPISKEHEYLKNILKYIHKNYYKDIKVTDIANSCYISVSTCNRTFNKHLHTTIYQYLLNYRIEKSLMLLSNTNESITDICSLVGFNNSSHFIKYFKKYINMTPNEYRKYFKLKVGI